jgi:hypothetical protein
MQKIVLNDDCWFAPSDAAIHAYAARKGIGIYGIDEAWMSKRYWTAPLDQKPEGGQQYFDFEKKHLLDPRKIPRNDPDFVAVVEELGADASDKNCMLKIVEIPDGVRWYIEDTGSSEIIHEEHRTWC